MIEKYIYVDIFKYIRMPKRIITLSEEADRALREYLRREYHDKPGALSITVEEAIRRFLETQTGKRMT